MICLTFDTDWMGNRDIERFLELFPIPGEATFFLHQAIPALHSTTHELCPHPFIDNLSSWLPRLEALSRDLPVAPRGVRPHSCVFSHMIALQLHQSGYRYVSQGMSLYQTGLSPLRHPWGIWELPIYYMDNMDFCAQQNWPGIKHTVFDERIIDAALKEKGLFVFDFHPLHIALNTRTHADYSRVKDRIIRNETSPFDLASGGRGTRDFFLQLCSAMRASGRQSSTCWNALKALEQPPC